MTLRTQQTAQQSYCIQNAQVVTPETVLEGGLRIEGSDLVAVGTDVRASDRDVVIDADGAYCLPGLIDLHGDDIESHLRPRNGERMDVGMALAAADRTNLTAGITTKFHAIAFENDPTEGRTTELAGELTRAVRRANSLAADHRIHVRCEVTQSEAVEAAIRDLTLDSVEMVSLMSHVPGKGQFEDVQAFKEYYDNSDRHSLAEAERFIEERQSISMATIRERIERVVSAARDAGVVTASHDDEDPGEVEWLHDAGIDITEYPITLATARRASELGMTTVMGAPNLVRGGSQWGNLESRAAIQAGVLDALCVDYHPPTLLASIFVDTGEPLPDRVARVTKHPADAVGLDDRGRLRTGTRADVILVDVNETPTVSRAFVAGDLALQIGGRS